ncbi:MAG: hypothetical protein ACT6XY_03065 [Phreatobacter sp.]|uniref:hypothetical protein n=1 Tax=Phreatobacter sp. TaxID=1966341 RepID=UPI004035DE3A
MKHLSASAVVGLVTLAAVTLPQPARAAGCGGYVNVFVSGCAPWDNNPRRMPGAPGYAAPRPTSPVIGQPRIVSPPRVIPQPTFGGGRIVGDHGGGLISNNRGGLISDNGLGARGSTMRR